MLKRTFRLESPPAIGTGTKADSHSVLEDFTWKEGQGNTFEDRNDPKIFNFSCIVSSGEWEQRYSVRLIATMAYRQPAAAEQRQEQNSTEFTKTVVIWRNFKAIFGSVIESADKEVLHTAFPPSPISFLHSLAGLHPLLTQTDRSAEPIIREEGLQRVIPSALHQC